MQIREEEPTPDTCHNALSPYSKSRRQALAGLALLLFPWHANATPPKLGDDEWFRQFHAFVRLFNNFVESLNDGKLDRSLWRQMHVAWQNMNQN